MVSLPPKKQSPLGFPKDWCRILHCFLIYINDLPDVLTCGCSLYAEDTLVYQEVTTAEQEAEFQQNISAVYQWSKQWQMPFKEGKSQLLLFGKTCTPTAISYKLGNTTMQRVVETK